MDFEPSKLHQNIIAILRSANALDERNAMTPKALVEACKAQGFGDARQLDEAIMTLIDHDIIEYEMDDNLEVACMWLL